MVETECDYNRNLRQANTTVNWVFTALENITDPLEIDGLVLRLDFRIIRTLVNLDNPQKVEIIQQLGEVSSPS